MRCLFLLAALAAFPVLSAAADEFEVDAYFPSNEFAYLNFIGSNLIEQATQENIHITIHNGNNDPDYLQRQLSDRDPNSPNPIIVYPANRKEALEAINFATRVQVPIIFLNNDPGTEVMSSYHDAWYIGFDKQLPGELLAEQLIIYYRQHPECDRNRDHSLGILLIEGTHRNAETIAYNLGFLNKLETSRINYRILAELRGGWMLPDTHDELAKGVKDKKIDPAEVEVIVCHNDMMALGALEWLRESGRNVRGGHRIVPVFGVDGIPPAVKAIAQGRMQGSVLRDARLMSTQVVILLKKLQAGDNPEELDGLELEDDYRMILPCSIINQPIAIKEQGF